MFLIQKYTQYKAAQEAQQKRKVTEKELVQLNHKIDKLLTKLDEHEPEIATNQDEECVVCVNAKATMQTYPCGHRVICRKCFVKTIQTAVAQRLLPLRCVICRAKILRLKHVNGNEPVSSMDGEDETDLDTGAGMASSPTSAASSSSSTSSATSALRQTISHWYKVPQSDSVYSFTSNGSRASSTSTASSLRSAASSTFASLRKSHSTYSRMGYEQLKNTSGNSPSPSPPSIRKILFPKKHQQQREQREKEREANATIPKSASMSIPINDSTAVSKKAHAIRGSRSTCQIHGTRQPQPQPPPHPHAKLSSSKLPKKEHRIVPVQPPKPGSMGLDPGPEYPKKKTNSNNHRSNGKSPASSTSSSASSSVSNSNNNIAAAQPQAQVHQHQHQHHATPLKGKFRLVQEFQREFHLANQAKKEQAHFHENQNLINRTVAIGGKFRCSRPSQSPRPCYCRDGSTITTATSATACGSGRSTGIGIPKDRSVHSISSCVAAIPSSSSTRPNINEVHPRLVTLTDEMPSSSSSIPSSHSCPSLKQISRPPRCNSHYHHHRCRGCGTDKLRKLETLIEVK